VPPIQIIIACGGLPQVAESNTPPPMDAGSAESLYAE
jgi:hypothetical protein